MTTALAIQLRKETRALLPWSAAVAAGTAGLAYLSAQNSGFPNFRYTQIVWLHIAYVAGVMAVAALSLGHEFAHGTLANLLVQPIDRRRVLLTKLVVTAAALLALGTLAELLFPDMRALGGTMHRPLLIWGPIVAGLGLVPILTLLTRKPLAGVVFSMTIPGTIVIVGDYFFPLRDGQLALTITWYGTLAVSATGFAALWVQFPRLQVADAGHARRETAHAFRPAVVGEQLVVVRRHWVWQLVKKELRLQQMTLAVSGLNVLSAAVMLLAEAFEPLSVSAMFDAASYLHAFFIVIIAGSVASAEERHLGTLTGQALQPVAAWKQWALKSGVALGLSAILALGLPLVLMLVDRRFDSFVFDEFVVGLALAGVAALYVSSISSNSLWALLACFPAIGGSLLIFGGIIVPVIGIVRRQFDGWSAPFYAVEEYLLFGLTAGLAALTLYMAGRNHRSVERNARMVLGQLGILAAYVAIAAVVYIGVGSFFHRSG